MLETYQNGDLISAFDQKMASDFVHFRVGPARLFQFRSECENFKILNENQTESWLEKLDYEPMEWQIDSPLLRYKLFGDYSKKFFYIFSVDRGSVTIKRFIQMIGNP